MLRKSMRAILGSVTVLALMSNQAFAQDTEEKPWIDMENCEICQHMAKHQDMMLKIKWGIYKLDNGFCSLSVVPDDCKATMEEAKKGMQETINKAMTGEKVNMCGHCSGYGELIAAGAKMKEFETVAGDMTMFTSDDAEVVAKLHEFADKTSAAHNEMLDAMGGHKHEHGDHSHEKDGDHSQDKDKN